METRSVSLEEIEKSSSVAERVVGREEKLFLDLRNNMVERSFERCVLH